MKCSRFAIPLLAVCFSAVSIYAAFPFTYQGRLYDDGSPAEGMYDFSFVLLSMNDPDDHEGMVSEVLKCRKVTVSNGYFTVELDFVPHPPSTEDDLFDGDDRWLSIHVIPSESEDPNDFQQLLPLPKIMATPYAHLSYRLKTPVLLYSESDSATLTISNEGPGAALLYADNHGKVSYSYDAVIDVMHDLTMQVGNSQFLTVSYDSTQDFGRNRTITVQGRETKTVAGDSETTVGENKNLIVGGDSVTTAGRNVHIEAGREMTFLSQNPIKLQEGVRVSHDSGDLLKVDGAMTIQPMIKSPKPTTGYGKLFVGNPDGRLYYIDTSGIVHNLTEVTDDRISFSVKRDVSYAWPAGSSFEVVDFTSDTAIWDNEGKGFDEKNGSFAVPADGLYTFHGSVFFTGLSKGDLIAAAINSDGKRYRGNTKTASGTNESVDADVTVYLEAGDLVTLEGNVQSASSVNVLGTSGADAFTYFNGARVD